MWCFGLTDLPSWLCIITLIVLTFYIYTKQKHNVFRSRNISGPTPLPFIGGLMDVIKKGITVCEYEGTLKYGKCFGFFMGNIPTMFITDTEMIKEVFVKRFMDYPTRSQAIYVSSFWEKTILMSTNHAHWKFLRSALSPSFTSGKLKKMDKLVISCVNDMVSIMRENLQSNAEMDVVQVYKGVSLDIICKTAFGVEANTQRDTNNEIVDLIKSMLSTDYGRNYKVVLHFLIPDFKHVCRLFDIDYNNTKSIKILAEIMKPVIEERRADKGHHVDFLQLMIDANKESEYVDNKADMNEHRSLSDEDVMANALVFLVAGTETTSTALIFASYFLATQPECQEKLILEIDTNIGHDEPTYETVQSLEYLEMFLSETMRLYPPATRTNRYNLEESEINGYNIPKGISITVPIYSLHRLEEYWPEPLKFDPERFSEANRAQIKPYTYLPFGIGPRMCIGTRFAQMEMKLTLVRVLQNFRFKPSPTLKIPPTLTKSIFCSPKDGMPLLLEAREN